jgi:P27 family predicted phage terminase small subunit
MRGRKPHPTALKLQRNNPGHKPLNYDEPKHDPLDQACPAELTDPAAQAEWARLADVLSERGQVTTVDRATLIGYCLKYAQWRALEIEAAQHAFVVKAPSGYPIPNPALGMANKVFGLMLKAAAELGITPSSRSRVHALKAESEDAFTAYQQKGAKLRRVK